MTARLERILTKLVQQNAPNLTLPSIPDPITRLQTTARRLASYDIVVIAGILPPDVGTMRELHVNDWMQGYGTMYHVLALGLFPAFAQITAHYADNNDPPVVFLRGQSTPIMEVLAGYIVPYVGLRQPHLHAVSDLELSGFMDLILNELEAADLDPGAYYALRQNGVQTLRMVLRSSVRTVSLTAFDQPIIDNLQQRPADLPEQQRAKIEQLPSDNEPDTPTQELFTVNIPIKRNPGRRPPVPPLPEDDVR